MKKKKLKKIKPVSPIKVVARVINELKDIFNLYEYFGINDEPISEQEKIKFVYETWEAIEFKHDFVRALFGDTYPTGNLEEWRFCEKCNMRTVYKGAEEKNINMDNFIYCPKCGKKAKYYVQKIMFTDVHIYRLRDMVIEPDKDRRLQYVDQMLDLKNKSKEETIKLDKEIENKIKKNK